MWYIYKYSSNYETIYILSIFYLVYRNVIWLLYNSIYTSVFGYFTLNKCTLLMDFSNLHLINFQFL